MALQVSRDELFYHRQNFYETMRVHGIPCRIHSINDTHESAYDFYNDIKDEELSFDDFIDTYMTYETLPTIKTLKSLGWYVENDNLPAVGYIPVLYKDKKERFAEFSPNLDDKVILTSNPYDKNSSERAFLIKEFIGNGFPSVVYYTCKLVPCRKDD